LLFTIVNSVVTGIVLPVAAKIQHKKEIGIFLIRLMLAYLFLIALAIGFTYLFPEWLLMFIGKQYAHLKAELFLMMVTTCFGYFTGIIWMFLSTKGWVKYQWLYAPVSIAILIVSMLFLDLKETRNIILFSGISNVGFFLVNLFSIYKGFSRSGAIPTVR
jgi:hypothetical protein